MQQVWWRWYEQNSTRCDPPCFWWLIDWCSCCWAQNSSKDAIRRGRMMILMQLFFSTKKLLKQAHVIIQTGECWLLEIWERRGSRILQRDSGTAQRIAWKKEALRERYGTTKTATNHSSKQETAAVAKPQRQQAEDRDREQASKQALVTTTVRTFCSATNNTATTTHQRRNRDAQKDKEPQRPGRAPPPSPPPSMKTMIQFVDSHSFIHHIRTFHPTHTYAPAYQFFGSKSTGRVGAG
jgi:hypothetical protein